MRILSLGEGLYHPVWPLHMIVAASQEGEDTCTALPLMAYWLTHIMWRHSRSVCGRNYWQRFSSPLKSSIARATQTKTKKPRAACLQVYTTWANIFKALTARKVSGSGSSSWGVKFSSSEQKSLRLARWYSIEYAPLSNVYVTSGQLDCKQTKQTFGCYVRQIKENCAVYYPPPPAHLVDILSGITRRLSTQTTILLSALLYFMTS